MWDYMRERAVACAKYMIETGCTVRACAAHFGVSKSTVHKDVSERLLLFELKGQFERAAPPRGQRNAPQILESGREKAAL